jgi:hypothetical protein
MPWDESSMDPTWAALYASIGTLVVAGGQLEATVRTVLLHLMGGPRWSRTGLVVEGYTAGQMAERCARLARNNLEGALRDDVLAWLEDVATVQRYRNSIVHADWASKVSLEHGREVGPAALTRKVTKSEGLKTNVDVHNADDIRAAAGRTAAVMLDGTELTMELQRYSSRERETGQDLTPWRREPDFEARRRQYPLRGPRIPRDDL